MKIQKILGILNISLLVIVPLVFYSCTQQPSKTSTEQATTQPEPEPMATGKITTIVDGMDVGTVKLWSSTDGSTRRVLKSFRNGNLVIVWKDADPYYQIESASRDGVKGYCMKGFVILDK